MNITEYRQLREAFGHEVKFVDAELEILPAWLMPVVDAARQTYDRWQICDCEDGLEYCPCYTHVPGDTMNGCYGREAKRVCLSCGGSGLQLKPEPELAQALADVLNYHLDRLQVFSNLETDLPIQFGPDAMATLLQNAAVRAFDKETE